MTPNNGAATVRPGQRVIVDLRSRHLRSRHVSTRSSRPGIPCREYLLRVLLGPCLGSVSSSARPSTRLRRRAACRLRPVGSTPAAGSSSIRADAGTRRALNGFDSTMKIARASIRHTLPSSRRAALEQESWPRARQSGAHPSNGRPYEQPCIFMLWFAQQLAWPARERPPVPPPPWDGTHQRLRSRALPKEQARLGLSLRPIAGRGLRCPLTPAAAVSAGRERAGSAGDVCSGSPLAAFAPDAPRGANDRSKAWDGSPRVASAPRHSPMAGLVKALAGAQQGSTCRPSDTGQWGAAGCRTTTWGT
jgi:hypothetical protein